MNRFIFSSMNYYLRLCFPLYFIFVLLSGLTPLHAQTVSGPQIILSTPADGYSDPRENRRADGTRVGITELQLTFSAPVESALGGALTPANFHLSFYRDGQEITNADIESRQSPTVTAVTGTGAGPYTLTLSQRIPLQAYTVVQARNITDTAKNPLLPANGRTRVVYSNLPMNVNQDGIVTGADINTFLLELNNAKNPLLIDMNRDGVIVGNDISRAVQLLNGINALKPWKNIDIGAHPESFLCTGNQPPVPSLATPVESAPSQPVSFDATATTDTTGVVVAYAWEFGDGAKGAGPTPSHSYSSPGTYTVRLTVTDNCGASATKTVAANILGEVVATFDISPENPRLNEPVTFTAHQPEADNIWHQWSFSDGYSSYLRSFSRSFTVGGNYGVKLTVLRKEAGVWNIQDISPWVSFAVQSAQFVSVVDVQGSIGVNVGVEISNGTAWSLGREKFVTVNIADPNSNSFGTVISQSGQFGGGFASALAASDKLIAVGAGGRGVFLFDPLKPDNLTPLSNVQFPYAPDPSSPHYPVTALTFDNDLLIVGLSNGFKVLDVSNPLQPTVVAGRTGFTTRGLHVAEGLLLVGQQIPSGISYFRAPSTINSLESELSPVGFIATTKIPGQMDEANGILVVNEYTYLQADLGVYDLRDNFRLIQRLSGQPSTYKGAAIFSNRIFSTSPTTLVSFRLMNRTSADIETGTYIGSGYYGDNVAVDSRGFIYVGASNTTLVIFRIEE